MRSRRGPTIGGPRRGVRQRSRRRRRRRLLSGGARTAGGRNASRSSQFQLPVLQVLADHVFASKPIHEVVDQWPKSHPSELQNAALQVFASHGWPSTSTSPVTGV